MMSAPTIRDVQQPRSIDGVVFVATFPTSTDQAGTLEDVEVLRDRLARRSKSVFHGQARTDLEECLTVAFDQLIQDRPPCGIGQGFEDIAHPGDHMQVATCMSNGSLRRREVQSLDSRRDGRAFGCGDAVMRRMSGKEIDEYLARLEEPKRTTLQNLRQTILSIIPQAEEGIAYGCPAFRLHDEVIAGFAAFKNHLSYLPHSGSVLRQLPHDIAGYRTSSGALQFAIDRPLPRTLVKKLIEVRLSEVENR
jgi:uncharacterized protein YdhG (YjbR/CyaY superfamily)